MTALTKGTFSHPCRCLLRPIDHPRPAYTPLKVNEWPLGLTPDLDRRDEWLDLTYAIISRRQLDQE